MPDFPLDSREPAPPPPASPPPTGTVTDDASTQALSEAFRSSFQVVKLIMAALLLLFLFSGVFEVKPNERAVILRFGRPVGDLSGELLGPGWHFAWPYPIDEPVKIPVGEIRTVTSTAGWHATTPEMEAMNQEPTPQGRLTPEADGYTISADGNIMHVRARVKYRITNPVRHIFAFDDAAAILTNVVNDAIIWASARFTADAALFKDRAGFRDAVLERVRARAEEMNLGISLEPSDVETKAPVDVRDALIAVNDAEQRRSQSISEAQSYRDETTSKALGEAARLVNDGITRSNQLVASVTSLVARFNELLPEYQRNRDLFERRLLTAAMERVLTNSQEKFFLPARPDGQPRELRLNLSREPLKREEATAP